MSNKSMNIEAIKKIQALMAELSAEEVKALTKAKTGSIKVSAKGGISVYGLGRFPVTLYKSQMLKFLDMADQIRAFISENEALLASKEAE